MPTLKRIPIDELQVGMVIIRSDKPGIIFDEYGIPLSSEDKIQSLRKNGVSFVFIWSKEDQFTAPSSSIAKPPKWLDEEKTKPKSKFVADEQPAGPLIIEPKDISLSDDKRSKRIVVPEPTPSISKQDNSLSTEQVVIANKLFEKSQEVITTSLNSIKRGEKVKVAALNNIIGEMVEATLIYPGVFTTVAMLESMGDAEYTHGLNVAILALSIGQTMGLQGNALIKLGVAGLLHDIGKSRIPDKLLLKRGTLTDQEFHILTKHPEWSEQILMKTPDISEEILSIVLHHHERADGSGYPSQLTSRYLSKLDLIVGIAEDYDTMIGGGIEAYPVLHSCEAVRRIYTGLGNKFPEEFVKAFLKTIGVFPVGAFVRLSNNNIAIVAELNRKNPLQPKVLVINDIESSTPEFINLSISDIKIDAPISPKDYNINPKYILSNYIEKSLELSG